MFGGIHHIRALGLILRPVGAFPSIAAATAIEKVAVIARSLRELAFWSIVVGREDKIWCRGIGLTAIDAYPRELALKKPLVGLVPLVDRRLNSPDMRGFWVVKQAHRFEISANLLAIASRLFCRTTNVSRFFSRASS